MALYTVHAPAGTDRDADPSAFVFVKDGFCWPALFIAPLWLVYRGLWLALLLYLVLAIGLSWLAGAVGGTAGTAVMLLFAVWFALEANQFRRWTVERRRPLIAVAEGRNVEEAEIRFFAGWADDTAAAPPPGPAPAAAAPPPPPSPPKQLPWKPSHEDGGVVGLFPRPGSGG